MFIRAHETSTDNRLKKMVVRNAQRLHIHSKTTFDT